MNQKNSIILLKAYLIIATYFYFFLNFKYPYTFYEYKVPAYFLWFMDILFITIISVILLTQQRLYKKVFISILFLFTILFIYNLIYTPFNYDLFGNIRLIKADFMYILVILAITSYNIKRIESYFNFIVYILIISNIIALTLLFIDNSLVYYLDRFMGVVGGPKNWAFLILIPILYHLYNIKYNKNLLDIILLPIELYSLMITGSLTGYIGLLFSIFIFMYLVNINNSRILLKLTLTTLITMILSLLGYYIIGAFTLFENVKLRLNQVLFLYSNGFDLDLILSNPHSGSVIERLDQLNAIISFFNNDIMTVLFGNNIYNTYTIAELYYFNILTNKGLIITVAYLSINAWLLFKFIKFFKKFGDKLTHNERRIFFITVPLFLFNVLIANFIESYTTRIPINIYYYSLIGITLGVMINFKRTQKNTLKSLADGYGKAQDITQQN